MTIVSININVLATAYCFSVILSFNLGAFAAVCQPTSNITPSSLYHRSILCDWQACPPMSSHLCRWTRWKRLCTMKIVYLFLSGTEQQQPNTCGHGGTLQGQEGDIQGTMSMPAVNGKNANIHCDVWKWEIVTGLWSFHYLSYFPQWDSGKADLPWLPAHDAISTELWKTIASHLGAH